MIVEYLRPKSLDEAIKLLNRNDPKTVPLGGGTVVSRSTSEPVAVVDLQDLGLNSITRKDGSIVIGAAATLFDVDKFMGSLDFSEAVQIQAGKNLRNSGTIAGLICTADGRSPVLTLLLGLDARIIWEPANKEISLGNWLPQRKTWRDGKLITRLTLPEVKFRFESIGRSPKDQPILCCAIAKWPGNRLRVAIGGFGTNPTLVLDGNVSDNVETAVKNALQDAKDQWASAEYRIEAGSKLCLRMTQDLLANNG
jgi:CO/xanthine dehydrogenase FAD-binding subunit